MVYGSVRTDLQRYIVLSEAEYESFLSEKPTRQFIQALEPTDVFLLPKTALYQLYEIIPKFERFGRMMAENAYLGSGKNNL